MLIRNLALRLANVERLAAVRCRSMTTVLSSSSASLMSLQPHQQQPKSSYYYYSTTSTPHLSSSSATSVQPDMFCRQCEQTLDQTACVSIGVCGKSSETSNCQDALIQQIKSVSAAAVQALAEGHTETSNETLQAIHVWTLVATFSTLTNVNFSQERIAEYIRQGQDLKEQMLSQLDTKPEKATSIQLGDLSLEELEDYGHSEVSVLQRQAAVNNDDAFALHELIQYGVKGLCAYAMHCYQLRGPNEGMNYDVMNELHNIYALLDTNETDINVLLPTVLKVGELNATIMALLDESHVTNFGIPVPTQVLTTPVEGRCILVSGHDMQDLHALLEQTAGTGINVYTHGEMLPAHGYPKLKEFPHLVGNYGTAWQNQKLEFATFPGPCVVTTNCIQEPRKHYKDRLYTYVLYIWLC